MRNANELIQKAIYCILSENSDIEQPVYTVVPPDQERPDKFIVIMPPQTTEGNTKEKFIVEGAVEVLCIDRQRQKDGSLRPVNSIADDVVLSLLPDIKFTPSIGSDAKVFIWYISNIDSQILERSVGRSVLSSIRITFAIQFN